MKKIISHLRRDLFGVGADAFLNNAVVSGKDKQQFAPQPGRNFSLDDGDAARQLFQFAQASLRLGQKVEPPLRCVFAGAIQRADLLQRLV